MSITGIARTYRSLQRLRQILQVLAKHGFGHLIDRMRLRRYLPLAGRITRKPPPAEEVLGAKRVRLVLQELGPTFVKLGQMLSNRPDLLPESYLQEFRLLQDRVAPFDSKLAHQRVEEELAGKLDELFSAFDSEPLASGSIAQVYYARTRDEQEVVVKVKRPGIEKTLLTDTDLMGQLARLAERHIPESRVIRPTLLVEELSRILKREMDFISEAAYTAKFYQAFADEKMVHTPEVYWEYTTSSVLTLGRLRGRNISEVIKEAPDSQRKLLARRLADAFMKQYFELGLFHGDPHPGNILVDEEGHISIVDFGMVGHLTEELKDQLAATVIALVNRDLDVIIDTYEDIGILPPEVDPAALKPELVELLDKYYGMPLALIDQRRVFLEVMAVARRYGLLIPRDFILLGKSLVTIISLAKELYPEFDVAASLHPYAERLARERYSPQKIARSFSVTAWQLLGLLQHAPRDLKRLLARTLAGRLQMVFRHEGLDDFTLQLGRSGNRLAASIIIGSLLLSASLILAMKVPPKLFDVPILGLAGYLVAGMLGIWLVIAILRSGRL